MSIPMSNPDPTAAIRQARQEAHLAAIDLDAVIVEIGGAVVRLIGEACLHIAGADKRPC
jgi:hypothetical protein